MHDIFCRSEGEIQKECKYLLEIYHNKKKIYAMRTNPYKGITKSGAYIDTCRAGCPDFTVLVNGRYVGFEIKTEKKNSKQSETQREAEKQIIASGGYYFLIRDCTEIRDILDKFLKL